MVFQEAVYKGISVRLSRTCGCVPIHTSYLGKSYNSVLEIQSFERHQCCRSFDRITRCEGYEKTTVNLHQLKAESLDLITAHNLQ